MTFYQELQLNQAGSKSLLKNSKHRKKNIPCVCIYGEDSCHNGFLLCLCHCLKHHIGKG